MSEKPIALKLPAAPQLVVTDNLTPGRELVPVPPPKPTLAELATAIRERHRKVEAALVDAVAEALEAGIALRVAKREVPHGNWKDYVAMECHFQMRTAQNYMLLAKYEPDVRQMLANKNAGRAYLTISEALKFINTLRKKDPRKAKPKIATQAKPN